MNKPTSFESVYMTALRDEGVTNVSDVHDMIVELLGSSSITDDLPQNSLRNFLRDQINMDTPVNRLTGDILCKLVRELNREHYTDYILSNKKYSVRVMPPLRLTERSKMSILKHAIEDAIRQCSDAHVPLRGDRIFATVSIGKADEKHDVGTLTTLQLQNMQDQLLGPFLQVLQPKITR